MTSVMTPRAGAEPLPYIGNDPYIALNDHEKHCLASHVELSPDVSTVDTPTFCGVKVFQGTVTWHLRLTLYQSFDDEGTDDNLATLWNAYVTNGEPVRFVIRPYRNRPVGKNNPQFSGEVTPQQYPLINVDAGAASTIELDWVLINPPTRSITATGAAATTPAGATSGSVPPATAAA